MRRLVLSRRAETDLVEIWIYSEQNWGAAQADCYLDALAKKLMAMAAKPERGRCRDDVRGGYLSILVGRHIAFYTFTAHEVLIQRVLHGSADPDRHLGP
jgi:toxin ParE1/3/4